MEDRKRLPLPGEFYRHDKGGLYQIVTVAALSETGEKLVIYQALSGRFGVFAQPLEQFMEETGRTDDLLEVPLRDELQAESGEEAGGAWGNEPDPVFLEFLDTDDWEEKLELLQKMKGRIGQREVDSLCMVLDVKSSGGTVEEQLDDLIRYLKMQQRYDAPRLRRG